MAVPQLAPVAFDDIRIQQCWLRLNCRLSGLDQSFPDYVTHALQVLETPTLHAYLDRAHELGRWGRGAGVVHAWLQYGPDIVRRTQADFQLHLMAALKQLNRSPNSRCLPLLIESVAQVCMHESGHTHPTRYLDLMLNFMHHTSSSIHGQDMTIESPGLSALLQTAPTLLNILTLSGLKNWMDYGARVYQRYPDQQIAYFQRQSKDSQAVIQKNRHGTLLIDADRQLALTLKAQWNLDNPRAGFDSEDALTKPTFDHDTIGLPVVLDDHLGVNAIMRYQLMQAHLAAHMQWSTPLFADNWSPIQRMCVEWFEDIRIDHLLLKRYPGFRHPMLALMPRMQGHECDQNQQSCILFKLSALSRCMFDPEFENATPQMQNESRTLRQSLEDETMSTETIAQTALRWLVKNRHPSDHKAEVSFEHTRWDWRDDNRILWRYIEQGDEEDTQPSPTKVNAQELTQLPACTYPEWDYLHQCERPDWVSVYEYLQPAGSYQVIDRLLEQYQGLAKQLESALEVLKPQDRQRVRHLEQGCELDFDLALTAMTDLRHGLTPSDRIHQDFVHCSRDISIQVLMDLSTSLNQPATDSDFTLLELSQCAVSLLAWAMDKLSDEFAIAGFHSNTRHDVRYMHIKGFSEPWGMNTKARLAQVQPHWSTRMGAALRHSARTLKARQKSKKLLLVLTDGQPSDIDVEDERWLIEDARRAVQDLQSQGIHVWCMQMHPQHSEITHQIYGHRYVSTQHIHHLAKDLLQLFFQLTG